MTGHQLLAQAMAMHEALDTAVADRPEGLSIATVDPDKLSVAASTAQVLVLQLMAAHGSISWEGLRRHTAREKHS